MENKAYLVKYYMDYSTHGIVAIFINKEDAERCAKIRTKEEKNIDIRYSVYEVSVYDSFHKYMDRWEVAE